MSVTAVAVRTHVPIRVGLDTVLIPMADAAQIMHAIARAVWPHDPSPMEEESYGYGRRQTDETLRMMLAVTNRVMAASAILSSPEIHDHCARPEALAALRGAR